MANDLDIPPLYDQLIKDNKKISDVWMDWFSGNYENMVGYLSQNGMFVPRLTTTERDAIQTPVNGQLICAATTAPAAITAPLPIVTPGKMMARGPIKT